MEPQQVYLLFVVLAMAVIIGRGANPCDGDKFPNKVVVRGHCYFALDAEKRKSMWEDAGAGKKKLNMVKAREACKAEGNEDTHVLRIYGDESSQEWIGLKADLFSKLTETSFPVDCIYYPQEGYKIINCTLEAPSDDSSTMLSFAHATKTVVDKEKERTDAEVATIGLICHYFDCAKMPEFKDYPCNEKVTKPPQETKPTEATKPPQETKPTEATKPPNETEPPEEPETPATGTRAIAPTKIGALLAIAVVCYGQIRG